MGPCLLPGHAKRIHYPLIRCNLQICLGDLLRLIEGRYLAIYLPEPRLGAELHLRSALHDDALIAFAAMCREIPDFPNDRPIGCD